MYMYYLFDRYCCTIIIVHRLERSVFSITNITIVPPLRTGEHRITYFLRIIIAISAALTVHLIDAHYC